MAITERITGNNKISGFVDIYNSNNIKLEEEIEILKNKVKLLEERCANKVDNSYIDNLIYNEVIRVLDTEYNSDSNPNRFVRIGEVKDIVRDLMNS